ncbi:hypothetical protein [Brevundimonas sp.]|uniref:hypothetical protein n=1 Tax=Brevundimonas sp. TaxID=1871086 RepID=UPI002730CF40|nr:hypothetical protein [Brevundimonas sp.]MDP1914396.1 hypothetical protein [Brevundimonas sp.]
MNALSPSAAMIIGAVLAVVSFIGGRAAALFVGWRIARRVSPGETSSADAGRKNVFLASDHGWVVWNPALYRHKNPEVRRLARRLAVAQFFAWMVPSVCLFLSWAVAKLMA